MNQLNLPSYSFKISGKESLQVIFDPLRRKYVRLTPEEWVRQNFIQYLVQEGKYPAGLIGVESMFIQNTLRRRVDILVHNRAGLPVMIVECKAPSVRLDDNVFDQIVRYNMVFKVPYLIVTNGLSHYVCRMDHDKKSYEYLLVIPLYEDLLQEAIP